MILVNGPSPCPHALAQKKVKPGARFGLWHLTKCGQAQFLVLGYDQPRLCRALLRGCQMSSGAGTASGSTQKPGGRGHLIRLTAAVLMSITTTCKRLGVDPFEYFRDPFQRISSYPQNSLDDLLPDK